MRPTLFLAVAGAASAMFAVNPEDVPLARLEENVARFLAKHPEDTRAHYLLGRIYCIAYATNSDVIQNVGPGSEEKLPDLTFPSLGETFLPRPSEASREEVRKRFDEQTSPLSPEDEVRMAQLVAAMDADDPATRDKAQADLSAMGTKILPALRNVLDAGKLSPEQKGRVEALIDALERSVFGVYCLKRAIEQYQIATTRLPEAELAWLGLGWCWEEAGRPKEALYAYRNAFERGVEKDLAQESWTHYSGAWHGSAALEAGERILALTTATTEEEKQARAALEEKVAALRAKADTASHWVTPIVVPLGDERTLAELLDPGRVVAFDLVGDGRARRWPWVRGTAGILAWDPRGTGRIRGAQQLFGSYTWSLPWRNGYEPLSWIDDDRDGRLRGRELAGLVIWRDADQDGVSDEGEVLPLAAWGIRSLGVQGTTWCPDGVERSDGETRPTWDWAPRSVR